MHMKGNLKIDKAIRWCEKETHSNTREFESVQDLTDYMRNAGDKLIIVDFFSPLPCWQLCSPPQGLYYMWPELLTLNMDYDKFYFMGSYINLQVPLMDISLIFYSSLIYRLQTYFHVFWE
jgi:hypothetical protein